MTRPPPPDVGRDPDAFEAFYREHLDGVRRFVARRVDDVHTAADLTADVFLAAIEHADRYDPRRGEPGAWLTGIARNVVAGYLRSTARESAAVRRLDARELLDDDSAYTFPTTRVAPGKTVRLRTGRGTDVPGTRYWGYRWYVWNNSGGDSATLRTASGAFVHRCAYTGRAPGVTYC